MLMYGRNQYNIVKQLSSNLNKLKKKQTYIWDLNHVPGSVQQWQMMAGW